jgi:enamine deaminase RidA (YjgF/YER057c/UK114 family)
MKTIEIPDDIDKLQLPIQEKFALATIRKRPKISNGAPAKELGVSVSGARTLISRLRQQRLVTHMEFDGSREFRLSVGQENAAPEGCQKVSQNALVRMEQKMTPATGQTGTAAENALTLIQEAGELIEFITKDLSEHRDARMSNFYATKLSELIERVKRHVDEPVKSQVLAELEKRRNLQAAVSYAIRTVPKAQHKQMAKLLYRAKEKELAALYDRIETERQLGPGAAKPLLLVEGPEAGTTAEANVISHEGGKQQSNEPEERR